MLIVYCQPIIAFTEKDLEHIRQILLLEKGKIVLDRKRYAGAVLIDLSKAFDS